MRMSFVNEWDRLCTRMFIKVAIRDNDYTAEWTECTALVDTGCTDSLISVRLQNRLHLDKGVGMLNAKAANQQVSRCPRYLSDVRIGDMVFPFTAVGVMNIDRSQDMVIGMDILSQLRVVIDNDGHTTLTLEREIL